ncbi:MAG TPA: hypothetical protein VK899_07900 [Gemmatimonadales bacterium]|nr:hypothetical protein [Gemmatimonadales bacterium]
MSEPMREPQTQDQRTITIITTTRTTRTTTTTTTTTTTGIHDLRGDSTVPADPMSPVIELDVNPGPPPRPRKEVIEKEVIEKEVIEKEVFQKTA